MNTSNSFRTLLFVFGFLFSMPCISQSLMKVYTAYQANWGDTAIRPYQKMEYEYDANGFKTGMTSSMWNKQRGEWRMNGKTEYVNDAAGNHLSSLTRAPKASGWTNESKAVFEYDAKWKLTLITNYYWRKSGADFTWVNDSKTAYTYDENGNELSHVYTVWREGAWLDLLRTNYHSEGYQYSESWDPKKGLWVKKYEQSSSSTEFHNNEVIKTSSDWSASKKSWVASFRTKSTYGSNGLITQNLMEQYDTLSKTWETWFKGAFKYNEHGEQVRGDVYKWNAETKTWSYVSYSTWEYEYRAKEITDAIYIKEGDILISPNPAQDMVTVTRTGNPNSENTITIFDSGGKMVKEFKTTGMYSTFSVKGMRPGAYTLDLVCEKENIYILKNLNVER